MSLDAYRARRQIQRVPSKIGKIFIMFVYNYVSMERHAIGERLLNVSDPEIRTNHGE
ncbi:hypothetical protein BN903_28 [Halorubrum sp. AJ67]|nr:hypothetical protein BN903_28 [Halorubrum sp. AJ67]